MWQIVPKCHDIKRQSDGQFWLVPLIWTCLGWSMSFILLGTAGWPRQNFLRGMAKHKWANRSIWNLLRSSLRTWTLLLPSRSIGQSKHKAKPKIKRWGNIFHLLSGRNFKVMTKGRIQWGLKPVLWSTKEKKAYDSVYFIMESHSLSVVLMIVIISSCYSSINIPPNSSNFSSTPLPRQPSDFHLASYKAISAGCSVFTFRYKSLGPVIIISYFNRWPY